MNKINTLELANKLKGYQLLESVERVAGVSREKAIYLIYLLRKNGYVRTMYGNKRKRMYYVAPENALGGENYIDILNKYAPIGIVSSEVHRIYGRKVGMEEVLIYALKKGEIRYIIASLALFRKIRDWGVLYKMAKKEGLVRQIGALYDVARLFVSKVRRMPKRFRNNAMPKKGERYIYIIDGFSSDSFRDIEKRWKVYIPLNAADLEDYKA